MLLVPRRLSGALALVALMASPARAAEDDDLAPLTPVKSRPKPAPAPPRVKATPPPPRKAAPPPARAGRPDDELAPLTPVASRGELSVRVPGAIQGAVLLVDGKELTPLPAGRQTLAVGEHLVAVRRPGFATFTRKVTVAAGRTVEVEARLVPSAAVLTVRTDVTEALVTVNGRPVGLTPLLELEVAPGPVELLVSRDGYLDEHQRLVVAAGRDYPVTLRLSPSPNAPAALDAPLDRSLAPGAQEPGPLGVSQASADPTPVTQRWYFWVGVAAVVTAAAVGTAVAVTAAQPPRPRTSAEICQGTCDACIGLACFAAFGAPAPR